MFLFRWIFGLLGLALSLLLLPLRLLGISKAVIWRPIRMVLKFIVKNTVAAALIAIAIFLVLHFKNSRPRLPAELKPASASPARPAANGKIPLVEAVSKHEDGDSNFATDLYALMTQQEQIDYSKNFYAAMGTTASGQVHGWTAYNIAGSIRPNDSFNNSYGDRCRHFNEVLKVHHIQQTISGTACAQGNGTWCKLRPNATPICGLSKNSGGLLNGISRSLGNLF